MGCTGTSVDRFRIIDEHFRIFDEKENMGDFYTDIDASNRTMNI